MKLPDIAAAAGAFLGMTAVIAGAMGAHALKKVLTPDKLESFITGTKYQMYHAILLLILGWLPAAWGLKYYSLSVWTAILGTLFFSGSIYILVFYPLKPLALVTPTGGLLLIISWFLLFLSVLMSGR